MTRTAGTQAVPPDDFTERLATIRFLAETKHATELVASFWVHHSRFEILAAKVCTANSLHAIVCLIQIAAQMRTFKLLPTFSRCVDAMTAQVADHPIDRDALRFAWTSKLLQFESKLLRKMSSKASERIFGFVRQDPVMFSSRGLPELAICFKIKRDPVPQKRIKNLAVLTEKIAHFNVSLADVQKFTSHHKAVLRSTKDRVEHHSDQIFGVVDVEVSVVEVESFLKNHPKHFCVIFSTVKMFPFRIHDVVCWCRLSVGIIFIIRTGRRRRGRRRWRRRGRRRWQRRRRTRRRRRRRRRTRRRRSRWWSLWDLEVLDQIFQAQVEANVCIFGFLVFHDGLQKRNRISKQNFSGPRSQNFFHLTLEHVACF